MRSKLSHPSVRPSSGWRRTLWKQPLWRQPWSVNPVTTIRHGQREAGAEAWCRRFGTGCRVQPDGLERDNFSSNRHPAPSFCLSMISGQTFCPARKPVPTPHQVRGRLFPDRALPIRIGDSLDLKFPVVDDPESRICIFLAEYRDAVDREHGEADCRKAVPQHRQDRLASLGVQPTRQCHVEAEIFHDIGIAPAVEVLALPLSQAPWTSSLQLI